MYGCMVVWLLLQSLYNRRHTSEEMNCITLTAKTTTTAMMMMMMTLATARSRIYHMMQSNYQLRRMITKFKPLYLNFQLKCVFWFDGLFSCCRLSSVSWLLH